MEKERKAIIVTEINYWKDHRLLPAHYCDFLLALYTEGEDNDGVEENSKKTPYYLLFYFFNTLLLTFPILFIQAMDDKWLQTIGVIVTLSIAFLMIRLFSRHSLLNVSYAIMIFLLCFLLSTILYFNEYVPFWWLTYLWVLFNSVVWILFGMWKRYFFVQVAGVFILILVAIMYGFRLF